MRKDIQALRAVAVLAVLLYHLWPLRLPGGFVGVDVFFVISGFLITSHLIKAPPRGLRDVVRFWGRRIQRLLPAVVVVITAVLVATVVWLPRSQWQESAHDALASMFYIENWRLITLATDYLDATKAHSAFQHFWSLSVEEQYYIVWPFVVGVLGWVSVRVFRSRASRTYALGFGIVVAASLAASVVLTTTNPAAAYFSTFTRMWELALGSLLAAVFPRWSTALRPHLRARAGLLLVGLAGILTSVLLIDDRTPFPGWVALVPTVATVAVILADDPASALNPRWLSGSRPVQFIGDTSYALYLWHWPMITLIPVVIGHALTTRDKLIVLALSVAVAWLSTRFVELPIRRSRALRRGTRRVFVGAVAASALVAAGSVGMSLAVARTQVATQETVAAAQAAAQSGGGCFGAAAMDPAYGCAPSSALLTTPEFAKSDFSKGIRDCLNWPPFPTTTVCTRGDTAAPSARIALMGNSHGGQWLPALEALATKNRWQVDTYVAAMCLPITAPTSFPGAINGVSAKDLTPMCQHYTQSLIDDVTAGSYDLVVISVMDLSAPPYTADYAATIKALTSAGKKVLVIRDTPSPMDNANETPDCVARHMNDLTLCSGAPTSWVRADPLADAAATIGTPTVRTVDLNRFLCSAQTCPPVIGGVIVYADINHMTATFAATLAPYLEPAIAGLLGEPARS